MKINNAFLPLALTYVFTMSQAAAQILGYSYLTSENQQRTSLVTETHINPANTTDLYVSSGLGRQVRISVLNGTSAVHQATSGIISISDKISFNGQSSYGKKMVLPALVSGINYTLHVETIGANSTIIHTENTQFTIDNTSPVIAGDFVWLGNAAYQHQLADGTWVLSHAHAAKMGVSGVSDDTGVSSVSFSSQYLDGESAGQFYATNLVGDYIDNQAIVGTGSQHSVNSSHFPSNTQAKMRFSFKVTDLAGNSSTFSEDAYISTLYPNFIPEPVAIFKGTSNNFLNLPSLSGFEPYVAGESISINPVQMIYKIPANYLKGTGVGDSDIYGGYVRVIGSVCGGLWTQGCIVHTEGEDAFVKVSSTSNGSGFDYQKVIYGNSRAWTKLSFKHELQLTADAMPPVLLDYHIYSEKLGWLTGNGSLSLTENFNGEASQVTKVKLLVEPRTYQQKSYFALGEDIVECIIPPNQSECIDTGFSSRLPVLDRVHHFHARPFVTNLAGDLQSESVSKIWRVDASPAEVVDYSVNVAAGTLSFALINNDANGSWGSSDIRILELLLENKSSGKITTINYPYPYNAPIDDSSTLDSIKYWYDFKYDKVDDGVYNVSIYVEDGFSTSKNGQGNNRQTFQLGEVSVDNVGPTITALNNATTDFSTVTDLEEISFSMSDASGVTEVKSIKLYNGPTGKVTYLAWRSVDDTYYLEYPRIFPSLESGQEYSIDITGADESGTVTILTKTFSYLPSSLVNQGVKTTLAVNQLLLDPADKPLSIIETDVLRTEDGLPARGIQNILITLRDDADFPITIQGITISPGATEQITFNVDDHNGRLVLPIYPSVNDVVGQAGYLVELPFIEGIWCSDGYSVEEDHCVKFVHTEESWDCPTNSYVLDNSSRTCTWTQTKSSIGDCPNGQQSVSATQCRYLSYGPSPSYQCPAGTSGSNCATTTTVEASGSCPRGYWNRSGICVAHTYFSCKSTYAPMPEGDCSLRRKRKTRMPGGVCGGDYPVDYSSTYCAMEDGPSWSYDPPYKYCSRGQLEYPSGDHCFDYNDTTPRTYTCPSGYTSDGSGNCTQTVYRDKIARCSSGYSLSGSSCIKYIYTMKPSAGCEGDWEDYGTNQCRLITTTEAVAQCPVNSDFDSVTDKCIETITTPFIELK